MSADQTTTQKKSRLLIVLAISLLVAASAGGSIWFFKFHKQAPSATPEVATELLEIEPFVVNLADDDRTYLRVGLDIAVERTASRKEKGPDKTLAAARDVVITVLTAQHVADLLTAEGKKKLRDELQNQINAQVKGVRVHSVFFTEFLLQH